MLARWQSLESRVHSSLRATSKSRVRAQLTLLAPVNPVFPKQPPAQHVNIVSVTDHSAIAPRHTCACEYSGYVDQPRFTVRYWERESFDKRR